MSPEATALLIRENSVLKGLVAGIMASLGLALMLVGAVVSFSTGEDSFAVLGLMAGASFIGLGAFLCKHRP